MFRIARTSGRSRTAVTRSENLRLRVMTFTDEPLDRVVEQLKRSLEPLSPGQPFTFYAPNPDLGAGLFTGEMFEHGGKRYRHRPLRVWLELAERLGCRLHTPEPEGALVKFTVSKRADTAWHDDKAGRETYGDTSAFSRVQKLEEPTFLLDYTDAVKRVSLPPKSRVLSLGVGRGDELIPFGSPFTGRELSFTGIDHSASALTTARARFTGDNYRFIQADLNELGELKLGRFDLIISIATFQSPSVNGHALIREVVQNHLTEHGCLILALPNCRYRDGETVYGAKMKNFAEPDLSLVVKDLAFYRKYLQQHRFRVFVTGKYYLFLTAVRA